MALDRKRLDGAVVVLGHAMELEGHLGGQFDVWLDAYDVLLERLAPDVVKEIGPATEELWVGKLPGLCVYGCAMGARGLRGR